MAVRKLDNDKKQKIDEMLKIVYNALDEKGYDPITQISGYLMSEDTHYIPLYNNARNLITGFDRDDINRYLLEGYFNI